MKILVTGSSGQIGSYVIDAARTAGAAAVGLDLRASKWTTKIGDVRDARTCRAALRGCKSVVHLAAQVSVQRSVQNPTRDADHNVLGTVSLLNAARTMGVRRFVFVSSAAVYGAPTRVPVKERDAATPLTPYGVGKLAGEHYSRVARELYGLPTIVVRPFNVYSSRQDPRSPYSGVISKFGARLARAERPQIFGEGKQTRDFVHASDVAEWLLRMADPAFDYEGTTPINLGTGVETSVSHLANVMIDMTRAGVVPEFLGARPGDISRSAADTKILRSLKLRKPIPLTQGLVETLRSS